jgi:quercetin dioxygenase-like cupin family protein
METSKVFSLVSAVEYSPESTVSRMIIKKQTGNITLFAFDAGQSLSEHSAPFDAFVQVVDGKGIITIDRKDYELSAGECIVMPANIPHAVKAIEKFRMMLVMIRGN